MAKQKTAPEQQPSQGELQTIAPQDGGPLPLAPAVTAGRVLSLAAQTFLSEAAGVEDTPAKPSFISINHKEGMFVSPTGELVPEVSGYILHQFRTRKFYLSSPKPGEKGKPPDCWSADLIVPHPSALVPQSEQCATCKKNQFGTGRDGRSKACAEPPWLFLFNLDFGSPPIACLMASTASLRPLYGTRFEGGYLDQAKKKHGAYQIVWTTFRLKHLGGGVEYSVLDPVMGPALADKEQVQALAQFHNRFKSILDEFRGKAATVAQEQQDGGGE